VPVSEKSVGRGKRQLRVKWQVYDPELVVDFCDQILHHAIAEDASDIHIEGFRYNARVRMRIDGALQIKDIYSEYLFKNYAAVISRFKILAECDIAEKRMAQDGAITITDEYGKDTDFRFSLIPTKNGERIVMRILASNPDLSLEKIGFDPGDYQKVIDAITAPQGMVLVTGPTGSGKTTTLYGALQHINSTDINILTAEDPIEYYLEGAGQVQANEKIGMGFSEILRSFLRQDPEVILVGEIRDQETIDIAVKAALTGHLLLSTLHTNDAVSTITRMLNMGVPNFMISSALSLIVAQRLARKNCSSCRSVDARVTPEMLAHIGYSEQELAFVKPMRGIGCPTCHGTGFKGRRGIYEVLRKTKEIEEAILSNATAPQILAAARVDGFKTMQEVGRDLIKTGEISVEEFQHTLVMD
jgi:type IV pilus assembly protein PilB